MRLSNVRKLLADTLSLRVPPRALVWGAFNTLNHWLRTGNRRFEFERLYLEHGDVWSVSSDPYEIEKYRRTLDAVLRWRKDAGKLIEIGCGVGAFTRMVAAHFGSVTGLDVSKEALRSAATSTAGIPNVKFIRGDLRSLRHSERYDVIVAAEVLYYISEADSPAVRRRLKALLAEDGVLVVVSGVSEVKSNVYFDDWKRVLGLDFELLHAELIDGSSRPYEITVYGHHI